MRTPPHDTSAERALLGMLLAEGADTLQVADGILTEDDYYATAHRSIWRAATAIHGRGHAVDMLTVRGELERRGELPGVGGDEYLLSLADAMSGSDAETLCKIIHDRAQRRQLITVCMDQASQAYGSEVDTDDLLDQTEARVMSVRREDGPGGLATARDSLVSYWQRAQAVNAAGGLLGVRTGIQAIDGMVSGLWDGDLVVVAGRPSMGKTAMLETLAVNVALHAQPNDRVLFFSAEMASAILWPRILAKLTDCGATYIRGLRNDGTQAYRDVMGAVDDAARLPLLIDDTSAIGIGQIRSRARRVAVKHRVRLVCIDYVQIIKAAQKHDRRDLEIGEVIRSCKSLAREFGCPVVVGAQIKREVAGRSDRRPLISDIRESGFIEEAADMIWLLHREAYYQPTMQDKGGAEIIIGKNRNGETGIAPCRYIAHRCMFADGDHGREYF